ncbi:MAG: hypothetical protein ACREGB_05555 [Candidatus Saccharimonadales bacterium]
MDKLRDQLRQLQAPLARIGRYRVLAFIVIVTGLYAFLVMRINTLNNEQPSAAAISSQSDPIRTAHVDKKVVAQLQALQDHSVNVQVLFEQARNNPFEDQSQ